MRDYDGYLRRKYERHRAAWEMKQREPVAINVGSLARRFWPWCCVCHRPARDFDVANLPTGFHVSIRCHDVGRTFVIAPPVTYSKGLDVPPAKYPKPDVEALVFEALNWFASETGDSNEQD